MGFTLRSGWDADCGSFRLAFQKKHENWASFSYFDLFFVGSNTVFYKKTVKAAQIYRCQDKKNPVFPCGIWRWGKNFLKSFLATECDFLNTLSCLSNVLILEHPCLKFTRIFNFATSRFQALNYLISVGEFFNIFSTLQNKLLAFWEKFEHIVLYPGSMDWKSKYFSKHSTSSDTIH